MLRSDVDVPVFRAPVLPVLALLSVLTSACTGAMASARNTLSAQATNELKKAGADVLDSGKAQLQAQAQKVGGQALGRGADIVANIVANVAVASIKSGSSAEEPRSATLAPVELPSREAGRSAAHCSGNEEAQHDRTREITDLAQTLLVRTGSFEVASAKLCEYRARRVAAEADIRHERAGSKYSGVLDEKRLHAAGRVMAEMDTQIKLLHERIGRQLQAPALPCVGGLLVVARCMAEAGSCRAEVEDIRGAWPAVESRLLGVDAVFREHQLRALLAPAEAMKASARAQAAGALLGEGQDRELNPYE